MATPLETIYNEHTREYDLLRSRMDYENNLDSELNSITEIQGKTVVELAAGTGRLTGLLAKDAASVYACDISERTIAFAKAKFLQQNLTNIIFHVTDSRNIPLGDNIADLVIEGWSLLHVGLDENNQRMGNWEQQVDKVLDEAIRITKPGGNVILIETLGTGKHSPSPPNQLLSDLYSYIENVRNFIPRPWIKTDYKFSNLDEAVNLTNLFWGSRLSNFVAENKSLILPECTGVWYWQKPLENNI